MSSQRWTILTLLATLAVAVAFVSLNVRLDVYGLFTDSSRRPLHFYGSERRAKYLLSRRHVPEAFNAVFLGSSVTANWDMAGIERLRTYNESIDGGNLSEEKLLVEQALRVSDRRRLEAALCLVHPYFTDTHGFKSEEMSDREYWGALGSISLLLSYKSLVQGALGRRPVSFWDARGTQEPDGAEARVELNPDLRRILSPAGDFHVDEAAFKEYGELVRELHDKGVRVVMVSPPLQEDLLQPTREAMDHYMSRMRTIFAPEDLLIDFNTADYAPFRRDQSNYKDGVHLTRKGAAEVVSQINQRLLAAGR